MRKLVFALSVSKLLSPPNDVGRMPEKEFVSKTTEISDTSFPIDADIVPSTPSDDTSNILTCSPEQVIPVQLHTVLSGIPPVQLQPSTPPRPFIFVAAATSHIASSFGVAVGAAVGECVGLGVGAEVGEFDGAPEGCSEG